MATDYTWKHVQTLLSAPIIAVDPGDKTGVFTVSGTMRSYKLETLTWTEILRWLTHRHLTSVLVIEDFITRPGNFARKQYGPLVIGALETWTHVNKVPIVYQQPSIKSMVPPRALRQAGWTWSTPHEKDALIHGLYYVLTRL